MKQQFFRWCNTLILAGILLQSISTILGTVPVSAAGKYCAAPDGSYVPVTNGYGIGPNGTEVKFSFARDAQGQLNSDASGYPIAEIQAQAAVGLVCIKEKAAIYGNGGWENAKKSANNGWWDACPKKGIVILYNAGCDYLKLVRQIYDDQIPQKAVSLAQGKNTARAKEIIDVNASIQGVCTSEGAADDVCNIIKAIYWQESYWQPHAAHPYEINKILQKDSNGKLKMIATGISAVTNYFPGGRVSTSDPNYTGGTGYNKTQLGQNRYDTSSDLGAIDRAVAEIVNTPFADQSDGLKKALQTQQSLPTSLLGDCQVKFDPAKGASDQNKTNRNTLVKCIGTILRVIFVVSILILIIRIAATQLGYVASAGDSSMGSGGAGPVVSTRNAIRDGLIGLILVGGAILILEVFNTGFTGAFDALLGGR